MEPWYLPRSWVFLMHENQPQETEIQQSAAISSHLSNKYNRAFFNNWKGCLGFGNESTPAQERRCNSGPARRWWIRVGGVEVGRLFADTSFLQGKYSYYLSLKQVTSKHILLHFCKAKYFLRNFFFIFYFCKKNNRCSSDHANAQCWQRKWSMELHARHWSQRAGEELCPELWAICRPSQGQATHWFLREGLPSLTRLNSGFHQASLRPQLPWAACLLPLSAPQSTCPAWDQGCRLIWSSALCLSG